MSKKYIFLDIDGVLWTAAWATHCQRLLKSGGERLMYEQWDPMATSTFQWILDQSEDISVVLSSTWRKNHTLEEIQEIATKSGMDGKRIVAFTPVIKGPGRVDRGKEIKAWMDEHKVSKDQIWILDDNNDMDRLMDRLYLTDSINGLTFVDAEELAERMGFKKGVHLV